MTTKQTEMSTKPEMQGERAELLRRFENAAHRKGELFERCQGKGWPTAESDEFTRLRDKDIPELRAALLAADDRAGGEAVKFLCNGTRFKMAFFDDGDDEDYGGTIHVKCFNNFEKELDGRWVALVAAEDDCHLKYTHPQPQAEAVRVPLTHEQITRAARALCKKTAETCGTDADDEWKIYGESYKEQALIALEAAHGIAKDQAL